MNYLYAIALFLLLLVAEPAQAARLSVEAPLAAAEAPFYLPVVLQTENDSINAVTGSILVPPGITIDSIDTSGSAFALFAEGPSYVLASHAIEFTAGAPHGIAAGEVALLFIVKAHAIAPGTYTFTPQNMSAYANDGAGSPASIAFSSTAVSVGAPGSVHVDPPKTEHAAPIIAAIGQDDSLFEGKWFATFYGGASGSAVDHYLVREGWWHGTVKANRYYVLEDQRRTTTLWITAVGENGKKVTTVIPAFEPWPERLLFAAIVLVAGALAALLWKMRRRRSH